MSKKLIAVASASALALSALVGVAPATASLSSVVINDHTDSTVTAVTSAAAPLKIAVPYANALAETTSDDVLGRAATQTVAKVTITVAVGNSITVNTTGAVKVVGALTVSGVAVLPSAGLSSWSYTNNTSSAEPKVIYVLTTSTAVGTMTIANGGSTGVYYIQGVAGPAYNVSVKFPTALGAGASGSIDASVTDVFGNAMPSPVTTSATNFTTDHTNTLTTSVLGAATVVSGGFTWNVTRQVYEGKITGNADGGPVSVNVALNAASQAAAGLAAPSASAFTTITNADLSATVATLTAQVATLQAQVADMRTKARSVTKKKYNTLARKWNAANPGARVALKK